MWNANYFSLPLKCVGENRVEGQRERGNKERESNRERESERARERERERETCKGGVVEKAIILSELGEIKQYLKRCILEEKKEYR